MRSIVMVGVMGAVALAAGPQASGPRAALDAMVAAERAFAARAASRGVPVAFHEFIADDGVLFRPDPQRGKPLLAEQIARSANGPSSPGPRPLLRWWPIVSRMSRSADMGWNTGPFVREAGTDRAYGYFVTVWKRQPDGRWRFAVDHGSATDAPSPFGPDTPVKARVDDRMMLPLGPEGRRLVGDALRAADAMLNAGLVRDVRVALTAALAEDARVMRRGPQPFEGREAFERVLPTLPPVRAAATLFADMAAAGDLGYTYGDISWDEQGSGKRGHYLRIWERQGEIWKVVLDEVVPVP